MGYLSCNAESAIATCDSYYWNLKKKNKIRNRKPNTQTLVKIREFEYSDIVAATNYFSADSFLGKGSHGSVYKASLDDGKLMAAVKRTKTSSKPNGTNFRNHNHKTYCTGWNDCLSQSENEIEILSRVRHPRRFVNLIGFCVDSNDNKLIVVEYMPNGSLYDLLHSASRPPVWSRRIRLAWQVAKAVLELHSVEPPVIHRDIKSSNVLIDERWNARLSDFGLALRGHVEDVRMKCTPPAGTFGYLDPCYLEPADLSTKSDVFSFGILLLELISGRNAIDVNYSPPSVVDWAVPLIKKGEFAVICDRRIGTPADPGVIRLLAVLACRCVRSTAEKRPSMMEVVECLKIVRKGGNALPIWSGLRRRVEMEEAVGIDEVSSSSARAVRVGGSRRNGKVSNIPYGNEPMSSFHVTRSKSVGSGSAERINDGPGSGVGRRKPGPVVAVGGKTGGARLSKSRSMGVLRSPRVLRWDSNVINASASREALSSKWEQKLQEKPLVC